MSSARNIDILSGSFRSGKEWVRSDLRRPYEPTYAAYLAVGQTRENWKKIREILILIRHF